MLAKVWSKLPAPYTITDSQIKSVYHAFYDNLLELYNKNDFYQIDYMLDIHRTKFIVTSLLYTALRDDPDSDAFLSKFASLLYKIATIYPVKHFKAQITAVMFLKDFLDMNEKYISFTFDWKPLYKIMKYFLQNKEAIFISGYDICGLGFDKIYLPKNQIPRFNSFNYLISHFSPDEIEIKSNGLIVKTNTTEQLLNKFIPKISINTFSRNEQLQKLITMLPSFKGRYKEYIEYLILIQKNIRDYTSLDLIDEIIKTNIEDDFSFVIPFISDGILEKHIDHIIPKIIVSLFMSPPTRKKILDLLENLFISIKKKYHPTKSIKFFDSFALCIAQNLKKGIHQIKKNDKNVKYYKMDKKLGPSKEDIHRLLSITCEITIINIQNVINSKIVGTLVCLDPTLIDRYFEIELQCISMTDAINVASNGWDIFSKLASFIDKSDTIRDNFVNLFQIGMDNFYNEELCPNICKFLYNCLQKVPFNNQKTLKGLEKTDFSYLASLFFTNLFNVFRTFNELEVKTNNASIFGFGIVLPSKYKNLMNISSACSTILLRNCSKEILSELFTFFTDLAYDRNLSPAVDAVKDIVSDYCIKASEEQAQKVIKEFQSQLDLSSSNPQLFEYYSSINATILLARYRSIESVNKTVDLILPYTKNDNEKIQKIAWNALYLCFSYFSFCNNAKVTFKSNKMNENSSEIGYFEDFDLEYLPVPDLSEKAFEVYGPIFEKLMQEKDQYKILSIVNEIGDYISETIQNIYLFTEGSNDIIYNNEISNIPQLTKKSVPIKDKFMESMCRIIHDFPENQTLVTKILNMVKKSIISKSNKTAFYDTPTLFDYSKTKMNKESLQLYAYSADSRRNFYLVTPLSNELKHFLDLTVGLLVSDNVKIRSNCSQFLFNVTGFYGSYIYPIITSKIIEKRDTFPIDVFVSFLRLLPRNEFLIVNDQLFCQTVLYLLKNFQENSKEKEFLDDFNQFIQDAIDTPLTVPSESNLEYENLLNEIEANYLNNAKTNRSLKNVVLQLIKLSLKHIKNINDNILKFIIDCITHFDQTISPNAVPILVIVLERRAKFTKERIEIKKFPTYETMPNILDKVVVKLPSNGFYFPSSKRSPEDAEIDEDEDMDTLWKSLSADYSVDIEPTNSIEVNMDGLTEDEDIIKVFETFKSIEIEWKMTEEERLLFDSEYMASPDSGYFKFADHYNHKKYEFTENKMLLKEIPNIFASAINSNNSCNGKIIFSNVDYLSVWNQYALTLGPFCIKKLAKISRKYLSKYFESSPEITSKVVIDLILGFMRSCVYWKIEDRITFYKLVVLPIFCVFVSSHNSSYYVVEIINSMLNYATPFSFAPIVKMIFELNRIDWQKSQGFARCLPSLLILRSPFMIHSIDQIKAQYIDKIDESNKKEICILAYVLMTSLFCLTYFYKGLPLYSDEVESKTIEFTSILDKILQKENARDFLTQFLIYTFQDFANMSYACRLLTAPIFIKNFHNIFKLLKNTKISTEDLFFSQFKSFLNNSVFFSNSSIKSEFLSSFISELMNSPLQAQSILLDSVNNMIEMKIFEFDFDEYAKYEDMFLKYGRVAKAANLGNEIRLKIAKILGNFEIRKCTLKKWNYSSEKVGDSEVDDVILKAAAIVLNSFLFDKVEDNLKNAFEYLENLCKNKKKGSANYEFFTSVLKIFITRHSGHVIKDAEELLIECQTKTSPSYMS